MYKYIYIGHTSYIYFGVRCLLLQVCLKKELSRSRLLQAEHSAQSGTTKTQPMKIEEPQLWKFWCTAMRATYAMLCDAVCCAFLLFEAAAAGGRCSCCISSGKCSGSYAPMLSRGGHLGIQSFSAIGSQFDNVGKEDLDAFALQHIRDLAWAKPLLKSAEPIRTAQLVTSTCLPENPPGGAENYLIRILKVCLTWARQLYSSIWYWLMQRCGGVYEGIPNSKCFHQKEGGRALVLTGLLPKESTEC